MSRLVHQMNWDFSEQYLPNLNSCPVTTPYFDVRERKDVCDGYLLKVNCFSLDVSRLSAMVVFSVPFLLYMMRSRKWTYGFASVVVCSLDSVSVVG